jgi:hypothetical protein
MTQIGNSDDFLNQTLKKVEQANNLEKYKTALKKAAFIREIKSGLGEEMKENPSGIKIIKKTLGQRVRQFLKKIFTRF